MDALNDTLLYFLTDYCEYLPSQVPVLKTVPSAAEFLDNHVVPNSPFLLSPKKGLFPTAVKAWDIEHHWRKHMHNLKVTVAATPNGRADAIVDDKFMVPEERLMYFQQYYDYFLKRKPHEVLYLQKQNNNFLEEFAPMVEDVGRDIPWATEAFGGRPEAANIWMGDSLSVTSLHKDHYENIYCVLSGVKTFKLYPPVSIAWMPYKKCPKFQWFFDEEEWRQIDLNEEVNWIVPGNRPETREKFKMFSNTKSYLVDVSAGEALYIPSLWFHEVHQTDKCIAVNYWYDMKYEMKYPYFCLLDALSKLPISRKDASNDTQPELEDQLLQDLLPELPIKKGFPKKDPSKKRF